jgi:hypothetical protein
MKLPLLQWDSTIAVISKGRSDLSIWQKLAHEACLTVEEVMTMPFADFCKRLAAVRRENA